MILSKPAISLLALSIAAIMPSAAQQATSGYLKKAQFPPNHREIMRAYGNRLEKPGAERLVLTGVLTTPKQTGSPVQIIAEFPGNLRVDTNGSSGKQSVIVTAGTTSKDVGQIDNDDSNLIESLLDDSTEFFLAGQLSGNAVRTLGRSVRLVGASSRATAATFCDLYEISGKTTGSGKSQQFRKTYCFNVDNQLLDRVFYVGSASGAGKRVETRITGWQAIQGQMIPGQIVRLEDGVVVQTLTIKSAQVSAKVQDNTFKKP